MRILYGRGEEEDEVENEKKRKNRSKWCVCVDGVCVCTVSSLRQCFLLLLPVQRCQWGRERVTCALQCFPFGREERGVEFPMMARYHHSHDSLFSPFFFVLFFWGGGEEWRLSIALF